MRENVFWQLQPVIWHEGDETRRERGEGEGERERKEELDNAQQSK